MKELQGSVENDVKVPVNHIKSSVYHWSVGEGGTKEGIIHDEPHEVRSGAWHEA